jgi:hypothetical protein
MSASTNPDGATGETLTTYYLWQYIGGEKKDIGVINIPKDHLIEDVRIVYGTVVNDPTSGGQTFVTCSTQSQDCHWYIEMKWYVWDGSHTDKWTYLPADDFVKDIDENNSNTDRGANVDVRYNPISGINEVSATTKVTIKNADGTGTKEFSRANGFHSLNSYTLNSVSGDVKTANAATNWTYDPFDKKVDIKIPTDVKHLNRNILKITYGSVCGKASGSETYDPGEGTENTFSSSRATEITVPKTIADITSSAMTYGDSCSGECLTVNTNICVSGNVVATKVYSTSDINKKENINSLGSDDYNKVDNFEFKTFNFKDDETKTKTYGVIAQDVQASGLSEIVHTDENGILSVDYISLLILEIANLKDKVKSLTNEVNELKNK